MRTDPFRYGERHKAICERAEREFLETRKKNPKFTAGLAVKGYAVAVRCAIARRDGTGIAAVLAAKSAHVVLKFGTASRSKSKPLRLHCRHATTPKAVTLPSFRPHAGA